MAQNTATDDRTDSQKIKMAEWFAEERAEYENSDGYTIVHEQDEFVIVADHTGHELNEWADRWDWDREQLRSTFRAMAADVLGGQEAHEVFSHSDPVVFDKFEG